MLRFLAIFLALVAAYYALTLSPWVDAHVLFPVMKASARGASATLGALGVRTTAKGVLVQGPRYACRVETCSDPRHLTLDSQVVVADLRRLGPDGRGLALVISFDSGSQGWTPLAMWIALGVATPLPWTKRLQALLAGALVIQLLVAATIFVTVSFNLTSEASPAWQRLALMLANRLLVENIWFSIVPPFLLWAFWLAWGGHWKQMSNRLCELKGIWFFAASAVLTLHR